METTNKNKIIFINKTNNYNKQVLLIIPVSFIYVLFINFNISL